MSGGAGWGDLQEEGAGEEEKGRKCCKSEDKADFLVLSQHLGVVLHFADFASFLAQKQCHTSMLALGVFLCKKGNKHISKN